MKLTDNTPATRVVEPKPMAQITLKAERTFTLPIDNLIDPYCFDEDESKVFNGTTTAELVAWVQKYIDIEYAGRLDNYISDYDFTSRLEFDIDIELLAAEQTDSYDRFVI